MDHINARPLISQLADDLGWLEQHCRSQPDQARSAGQIRLAAALVRNCIGPYLDDEPPTPLHVVIVGGAGAGKSTLANLLSGAAAAEANPQAGFTRHPIAYTGTNSTTNWAGHPGFLGPLQRLTQPGPSSLDEDVYQVRRVQSDPNSFDILKDYVIWDCPDMTTWAATGYIPRLIEAAALADVLVYAASDERYNDEMPTQFLSLLLQSGKPVVVCLMKMREVDAAALVAHFQKEVIARMPPGVVGVLPIPFLPAAQLADPARSASRYRIPLINQVNVLGSPAAAARRRSVAGSMNYLIRNLDQLLAVAKNDVAALQRWQQLVGEGRREFEGRYQREYLASERFRGFDEALIRLLQLLEFPGIGKVITGALTVLKAPFKLLGGWLGKAVGRPEATNRPELPVLEESLTGWIDLTRKEAVRYAPTHPLWAHVSKGFQSMGLGDQIREQFTLHLRTFQSSLSNEMDRTARAIYEELERKPILLNSLRTSKLALEVAAIGGTIATIGIGNIWNILLLPLVTAVTHQLVELLGKQFVDAQREQTRQRQADLMKQTLAAPIAEWLAKWPATGGSSFERLQLALRRIPEGIRKLNEFTLKRLATPS
jgi:energy-coupling factor transporter ATP-binding protein EcfA2